MATLQLKKGLEANLPETIVDGAMWLCTDTGKFYIDNEERRFHVNHELEKLEELNNTWSGKNLGTSVTAAQYAAIANGSFKGLGLGDYWTLNSRKYRIAAFDYYMNKGGETRHHLVIVPDAYHFGGMYSMNNTATNTGGYAASLMHTCGDGDDGLSYAKDLINNAFGEHLMQHPVTLYNTADNSGVIVQTCDVELMHQLMVYGEVSTTYTAPGSSAMFEQKQLPLFKIGGNSYIYPGADTYSCWWLQEGYGSDKFCIVKKENSGSPLLTSSVVNSNVVVVGVRPWFCIC